MGQFLVAYLHDRAHLTTLLQMRQKLGNEAWRLQVFDHQKFRSSLPKRLRSWPGMGWGPSAGMMAFWFATALCKSIDIYGFSGTVPGPMYHAYAWCDVDRILKVKTVDCNQLKRNQGLGGRRLPIERSRFGFTQTMTGHNF